MSELTEMHDAIYRRWRMDRIAGMVGWPVDVIVYYFLWTVFGLPWWLLALIFLSILGSIGSGVSMNKLEKKMDNLEEGATKRRGIEGFPPRWP